MSTDKVDAEVPSPVAGEIVEILVAGGRHRADRRASRRDHRDDGEVARPRRGPTAPRRPAPTPASHRPVARRLLRLPAALCSGSSAAIGAGRRPVQQHPQAHRREPHAVACARRRTRSSPSRSTTRAVNKVRAAAKADLPAASSMRAVVDALAEFPRLSASVVGDDLVVHEPSTSASPSTSTSRASIGARHPRRAEQDARRARGRGCRPRSARTRKRLTRGRPRRRHLHDHATPAAYGTLLTGPIINQPQVGIVSTDGVTMRPVAIATDDGEYGVAVHPMGNIAMSVRPSGERWCVLLGVPREGEADPADRATGAPRLRASMPQPVRATPQTTPAAPTAPAAPVEFRVTR